MFPQTDRKTALLSPCAPSLFFALSIWTHKSRWLYAGLFWVTGKWIMVWVTSLKPSHQYVGLVSKLKTRTLCSCQLASRQVTSTQLAAEWAEAEKQTVYGPPKMLRMLQQTRSCFGNGRETYSFQWWLKRKKKEKVLRLWSALTWRWKVEKWMSGMKRTGWVSRSVIILKMVTSLRFWSIGTFTSATLRRGQQEAI